jgi:hypothetical protein|tara:strand:- start:897 stop:1133 length:237 start_codon:yes stop_codon:yes gene_type:complete
MEFAEYMFLTLGAMLSMLAFFLKRESNKIERISSKLREIEIELAKNGARDCEQWTQTTKLLEDRRVDIIKIYEFINRK